MSEHVEVLVREVEYRHDGPDAYSALVFVQGEGVERWPIGAEQAKAIADELRRVRGDDEPPRVQPGPPDEIVISPEVPWGIKFTLQRPTRTLPLTT